MPALLAGTALTVPGAATAAPAAWTPKPAPTTTPWTNQVPVDHPLPEYPRPQLTRPDWANLNGVWDFAVTSADAGRPAAFPEQIRVPFVAESALSGIQRRVTQSDGGRDRGTPGGVCARRRPSRSSQSGEGSNLRREVHQQVDVVGLAVELHQLGLMKSLSRV